MTTRARRRGLWLVLVAAAWLARSVVAADAAGATNIPGVDEFIDAPRALFGTTRAEIEGKLGSPLAVRERRVDHPRDPGVSRRVQELAYPGIVLRVSASATLLGVEIFETRYPLPEGLGIGASRRDVDRVLGEPQQLTDTRYLYLYSDGYPDTVEFHFRGDRVHRIEWTYWVE